MSDRRRQLVQALLPIEQMEELHFVQWDRFSFSEHTGSLSVFGWIPHQDRWPDFVVLLVTEEGVGYVTSSAKYSQEIGERLNGEDAMELHSPCERVEHFVDSHFPNALRMSVYDIPLTSPPDDGASF